MPTLEDTTYFTAILNEIPAEEELVIHKILAEIPSTEKKTIHFDARTMAEKGWINPLTAEPEEV